MRNTALQRIVVEECEVPIIILSKIVKPLSYYYVFIFTAYLSQPSKFVLHATWPLVLYQTFVSDMSYSYNIM